MTNISQRKTGGKDYDVAYEQLAKLISGLHGKSAHYLLDELLTETERVMLVKRFAAIFMFQQEYSPYRVSQVIALSESTAQRLFSQYQIGTYDNLLLCLKKAEKSDFRALIEDLIMAQVNMKTRRRLVNRNKV